MYQGVLRIATLGLLAAGSACDYIDRARAGGEAAEAAGGVVLGLEAPGMIRPGEEGIVRLSLSNRGDTVVHGVVVELLVPQWMEPIAPEPTGREVTISATPEEGTRLSFRMDDPPLQPGETQSVSQRIRIPETGVVAEGAAPWSRVVRARLIGPAGQPLAEVESEITIDTTGMADTLRSDTLRGGEPVVGREGVGPVRLGMTAGAVRQAAPQTRDTTWMVEGTREQGMVVPLEGRGQVTTVLTGDTVSRIYVRDRTIRTEEGLGVGSRLEELRSAYGRPCADVGEGVVVVWFPNRPGVSFALDAPVPENPRQIREDPDRVPGSAQVTRFWLRRGADRC